MAAGLTYNGITIAFGANQGVSHVAVRDPSNVDRLYTRTTFRVRGIIAPGVVPAVGGETPTDTFNRVKCTLMVARKRLQYVAPDGKTLIDIGGSDGADHDAANGPTPLECVLEGMFEGSFIVLYTVECNLGCCPAGGSNPNPFLSLRWEESTDYDANWFCTKRRAGHLVVSRADNISPDDLRLLVTPDVPRGFRRERASYTLDSAGLALKFEFVDKELYRPPPLKATRMKGKMVESVPLPGALRYGEISLRLEGPRATNPRDLLTAAVVIAIGRAQQAGVISSKTGRHIMGGSVAESLNDDECAVEVVVKWMMKPTRDTLKGQQTPSQGFWDGFWGGILGGGNQGPSSAPPGDGTAAGAAPRPNDQGRDKAGLAMFGNWVGTDVTGSDPTRAISPPIRGTATRVKLAAAALNDPCGQSIALPEALGDDVELVGTDESGAELRATVNPTLAFTDSGDTQAALYDDTVPGVYDHYVTAAEYADDNGVAVCPSTKAGEPSQKVRLHNGQVTLCFKWSAARDGGRPAVPDPNPPSSETNWVLISGPSKIVADGVDLAADGVSLRYEVCGVYHYAALDRTKVDVRAPVPPFLSMTVANEASKICSLLAPGVIFGDLPGSGVNPWLGRNTEQLQRDGGTTGGAGGPPVNP